MIINPKVKIILGFIAGLLYFSDTYSQTLYSKGTTELGGTILFSGRTFESNDPQYDSFDNTDVNTFTFNIYLGKMVTEGFELGLIPTYTSVSQGNYSANIFGGYLAPAAVFKSKGTGHPFIQAMVGYINSNEKYYSSNSATQGFGLGLSTGIKITLGTGGLMLIEFQYLGQHFDNKKSFNTLSFGMGFRVFIPKKTEAK